MSTVEMSTVETPISIVKNEKKKTNKKECM